MNPVTDIHTHNESAGGNAIINILQQNFNPTTGLYYSAGIHPWYLPEKENWENFYDLIRQPQVIAIGEAGLDKLAKAPIHRQLHFFLKQAEIANHLKKPLIIHSVRTLNEIIRIKSDIKPDNPWIIHGFRGKPEMMEQLIHHGFYLSFGEKYNDETLKKTPVDRIFLETDESHIPIDELYLRAATIYESGTETFRKKVKQNIDRVFFRG